MPSRGSARFNLANGLVCGRGSSCGSRSGVNAALLPRLSRCSTIWFQPKWLGLTLGVWLLCGRSSPAGDYAFSNSLAQAALAEPRADLPATLKILDRSAQLEATNVMSLCVLARRYCDLVSRPNSVAIRKELVARALACSLQAVKADSNNATAHACVAVCYAKACAFVSLKTQLDYSRRFKLEAERTIALDPKQDIAYYLLGRWNYEIANVGRWSRAYVKLVYGGLPNASIQDAMADFQQAVELAPNRIIHHAGLAMAYEAAGERQRAIAELKQCRALKPFGPEDQDAQREAVKKLAALGW